MSIRYATGAQRGRSIAAMKDLYKPIRKRLMKMAKTWQPLFGLDDYDIKFEYWEHAWNADKPTTIMFVTASWCYKWATIQVNLPLAAKRTRRDLECDLLHEIGHILCCILPITSPEGTDRPEHGTTVEEERFVTDLAQSIQRIADHFHAAGKKAGHEKKVAVIGEASPAV